MTPDPTPTPRLLRIQEVAAEVGLTARSIRYYEEIGLLEPAARAVANTEEVINAHLAIVATYQRGDRRAAMDQFMTHVFGNGYRRVLDAAVRRVERGGAVVVPARRAPVRTAATSSNRKTRRNGC